MKNELIVKEKTNQSPKLSLPQLLIVIGLIIAIFLVIFFTIYFKKDNTFKRYLTKNGYICADSTCSKQDNLDIYTFNFKNGNFTYRTPDYIFKINDESYSLDNKEELISCSFKNDGNKVSIKDDNSKCNKYLDKMNELIEYYNEVMTKTKFKQKK